jgi:hypothetical protein
MYVFSLVFSMSLLDFNSFLKKFPSMDCLHPIELFIIIFLKEETLFLIQWIFTGPREWCWRARCWCVWFVYFSFSSFLSTFLSSVAANANACAWWSWARWIWSLVVAVE